MLIFFRTLLITILTVTPGYSLAAESFRFGWLPSVSYFDVRDPSGPTDDHTSATYLSGVVIADVGRDSRLFIHGHYDSFTLAASTTNIHQAVTRYGLNASYQVNLRLSRTWKPWAGAGLGFVQEDAKERYTVTPGGFLGTTFQDRSLNTFGFVLNFSNEWQLNGNWDLGVHFQYEHPFDDAARVLRAGVYFVY